MRLRFLGWIAVVACLLGMMLAIVAGHVRSAARDWHEANYRMGEGAYQLMVLPNPAGEAPNPQRSAAINEELRALLAGQDVLVVLDAQDRDGPRVGLYDPGGRLYLPVSRGRTFEAHDFGQTATKAVIREDSYLVGREGRYLRPEVEVLGYFTGQATPFTQEYVYTLFSQDNIHGTYYLDAEAQLVAQFEAALRRGDYLVESQPIERNVLAVIQSEALTLVYAASVLLVYGTVLLLYLNWAEENQRRYAIEYRYGAYPIVFSLRMVRRMIAPVLVGSALGAVLAVWILRRLGTLSAHPGIFEIISVVLGNSVTMWSMFIIAVSLRTRGWGRA